MAKLIKGVNDLATLRPDLADEWDVIKNNGILPSDICAKSGKKYWWQCPQGHSYESVVAKRTEYNRGCPYCAGQKPIVGVTDLQTLYPDIAKEWDYEKNEKGLNPSMVLPRSNHKFWWKCNRGHSWQSSLNSRFDKLTGAYHGCPYCSGKRILSGFNDLATRRPDLAKEWHPLKNGDLKPTDVALNYSKKVWWLGECGHEWYISPNVRVSKGGTSCPICAKELSTSFPEQAVFYYIKKYFSDACNSDRNILDGMELDIYIPSLNVGIEYDGGAWHKNVRKDLRKTKLCMARGITLYRIRESTSPDLDDSSRVYIYTYPNYEELEIIIKHLLSIFGCSDFDVNIDRDKHDIMSYYMERKKSDSLAVQFPLVAAEWDYVKNKNITPEMIASHSNNKFWFICPNGHSYEAVVHNRVVGHGCPICAHAVLGLSRRRRVINIDTGEIFDGVQEAAKSCNGSAGNICACCRGRRDIAFGYHWKYVDEEDDCV